VDDVSFTIPAGTVMGLVGESGCGKSTLARMVMGLMEPTGGEVLVDGRSLSGMDRRARARLIQLVPQDPYSSLNPKRQVRDNIALPLVAQKSYAAREIEAIVHATMGQVGLRPDMASRYPAELSGGQRQRVAIARALVVRPRILVCDEPTSALDVSVQAQILNVLAELRRSLDLTMLFISHNLAVIEHIASHVGVMYLGRLVEWETVGALFADAKHPYSRALLASVLPPTPGRGIPDLGLGDSGVRPAAPEGCRFEPRCKAREEICRSEPPPRLAGVGSAECHLVSPAA
jgi:peptide/nickel transport system ATP-binding protein